ncbi:MAG: hypothetical protein NTV04_20660, partial [Deltaproteobacteria bacterium]|nr:hypothetical protein [Deltaproteobacteria bacterium]
MNRASLILALMAATLLCRPLQAGTGYIVDNLVELTPEPLYQQSAVFNSDGTKLAYRQLYSPLNWANCDIWTMNPDGSGKQRVTTSLSAFDPAFVPDGRISYVLEVSSNDYNIRIINSDGTNPHGLIGGPFRQQMHDWRPDGLQLAYTNEYQHDVGNEIWTADAHGSVRTPLTDHNVDGQSQSYPVFSWSGNKIAYANQATSGGDTQVWTMNSNGGMKQPVTSGAGGRTPMFWWPGDTAIGFTQRGTTGKSELWLHNVSTGTEERLLAIPGADIDYADLSPSGKKLALTISDSTGSHIWAGDVRPKEPVPPPQRIALAWDTDVPGTVATLFGSPVGILPWGSEPAASFDSAFKSEVLQKVKDRFAVSGVTNVVVTENPAPGDIVVYFMRESFPSTTVGFAFDGAPDRFNRHSGGGVVVGGIVCSSDMLAGIVAHEAAHTLGLIHVDPDHRISDPGDLEIMHKGLCDARRFVNAVSPATDLILTGYTHNPLYHLRRYTDGVADGDLLAEGIRPGTWDWSLEFGVTPIKVRLSFDGPDVELYSLCLLRTDGTCESSTSIGYFDHLSLRELSEMEFLLEDGDFLRLVASSAPGAQPDVVLATGDPREAANQFVKAVGGD